MSENEQQRSETDPAADVRRLFERLGNEADERAVLSAVYQRVDEELTIRHASLLIGPARMSKVPWVTWRGESTPRLGAHLGGLSGLPADILIERASTQDGTELVAGRATMELEDAGRLLTDVVARGRDRR